MKVLNLQCAGMHTFEGWFGSEEDYQSQRERNLVACPMCANTEVRKLPSAPRLNLGASEPRHGKPDAKEGDNASSSSTSTPSSSSASSSANAPAISQQAAEVVAETLSQVHPEAVQMAQEAWVKMVKHVMANTEDVGQNFAEEARKMHYGESEERNIRGQASVEETQELLEEGIEVLPLPVPDALKGGLQ